MVMIASVAGLTTGEYLYGLVPYAHATENLFYGSSEFESLASTQLDKSSIFQINIQYDVGPNEIFNVKPMFSFYPESAASFVRIEEGSIDRLIRGSVGTITNAITVDSEFYLNNIFISVYFAGTDDEGNYYESGWIDSVLMEIGQQSTPIIPPVTNNQDQLKSLPPLKQMRAGIAPEDITCKEGFVIAIKTSNGNPSCMKPGTKAKLLERGWVS